MACKQSFGRAARVARRPLRAAWYTMGCGNDGGMERRWRGMTAEGLDGFAAVYHPGEFKTERMVKQEG